ncbi:MAG: polymer-forming cytoskeletal protein [Roseibacillus sp.]
MFQKNSSTPNKEESTGASGADPSEGKAKNEKPSKKSGGANVILSDVEIKGTVKFKNDVVIDGKIDGKIFSDGSVTIGRSATVNAEIRSKCVMVQGCVNGDIYASERLELAENAEVTGDIKAAVLSMEAGAILVGTSAVGSVPSQETSRGNEPESSRREREMAHT